MTLAHKQRHNRLCHLARQTLLSKRSVWLQLDIKPHKLLQVLILYLYFSTQTAGLPFGNNRSQHFHSTLPPWIPKPSYYESKPEMTIGASSSHCTVPDFMDMGGDAKF